jgi:hypothetical protein
MLSRYDSIRPVSSNLDPIEDFLNWVAGLRSNGYVSDLLKCIHGFSISTDIRIASKAITAHAKNTVNLFEQGFSCPKDVSFLPLYYAMLNLAKIQIIFLGNYNQLAIQRSHGASYNPNRKISKDLLNEEIKLYCKGTIPLYYSSITKEQLIKKGNFLIIKLKDIYPYIRTVSHEYCSIYHQKNIFIPIEIQVDGDDKRGYRLISRLKQSMDKRNVKVLANFTKEPDIKQRKKGRIINLTGTSSYKTKLLKCTKEEYVKKIDNILRRDLLYLHSGHNASCTVITPTSVGKIIWPEELAVILIFFHMSNIVRYNPEMLEQLKDTKAWTLLLSLIRYGTLSFLENSWSNIKKEHTKIVSL